MLTLPVVHALRAAYPEARIDYWVKEEYADVVRFDPAVSHVRTLESDARRLEDLVSMSRELEERDLIVDLHGNSRTRVLTFRQKAPMLRVHSQRLGKPHSHPLTGRLVAILYMENIGRRSNHGRFGGASKRPSQVPSAVPDPFCYHVYRSLWLIGHECILMEALAAGEN